MHQMVVMVVVVVGLLRLWTVVQALLVIRSCGKTVEKIYYFILKVNGSFLLWLNKNNCLEFWDKFIPVRAN